MNTFRLALSLLILVSLLIIYSCGGGGGGDAPDTTPPTVLSSSPSSDATDIAINIAPSASFDENISPSSANNSTVILKKAGDITAVAGSVSCSDTSITFTPGSNLDYSTTYTFTITSGVTDMAGNALTGDYTCSFTTGIAPDITAPIVTSVSPLNNAVNVPVSTIITANFSEPMAPITVNNTTFAVEDNLGNPISGAVGYSGTTATFTPDSPLNYSTPYTATITTGVQDLAGNPLATAHVWSFDTSTTSTFTISKTGTGTGTVTSVPTGINCGLDCTEVFIDGTSVTLTAPPDAGSVFDGLSGGCTSIEPTCTIDINGDVLVTAIFNTDTTPATGNQLGLDGIDDVAVHELQIDPATSALDLPTFTIEAWIFPLANRQMIIAADSAYYLMVKPQDAYNPLRVEFAVMTAIGFPSTIAFSGNISPLMFNQWNHVAGVYDNSTRLLRVAVNGELSSTVTAPASISFIWLQTFSVGNSYPETLGDFPFVGRVDEVRLSSTTRYIADFSSLPLLAIDGDTIGLWHFDDAQESTTFTDSSSNGNTLTGLNGAKSIHGSRELFNELPIADAGTDKNYTTGALVTLDGSNSSDADNDSLSFAWTISTNPAGSSTTLDDPTAETPSFIADIEGTYSISLIVSDGISGSSTDHVTIMAITPNVATNLIPDTGQTNCYDNVGNSIPCSGTGQDGEYSINPMSFTNNLDGTVTDNVTGLMWERGDSTATYNWFEASGLVDDIYNPGGAINVCESLSLAGYNDWRLPSRSELIRIMDYGSISAAINTTYFTYTTDIPATSYWATNVYLTDPTRAWLVSTLNGMTGYPYKAYDGGRVKCVRGDIAPAMLFADNGDGTITDINTGLMWMTDWIYGSWDQVLLDCKSSTLSGYNDWRLANIKELDSIVNHKLANTTLDSNYFNDNWSEFYSSSTTYLGDPVDLWYIHSGSGYVGYTIYKPDWTQHARCVR